MNESTLKNETNRMYLEEMKKGIAEQLNEVLRRGYFGNVTFRLALQDWIIQNIVLGREKGVRPKTP